MEAISRSTSLQPKRKPSCFLLLLFAHCLRTESAIGCCPLGERAIVVSPLRSATMAMPPSRRVGRRRRRQRHHLRAIAACVVVVASIAIAISCSFIASAQQLPVPAPDSLERWAAEHQEQTTAASGAASGSPLGPQFSFVRAPKPRQQQGTPGVALGGKGGGAGAGGAATKARAAFVGLGDPLPPGLAKRWKDPSVPIDIDTEEVRGRERVFFWRGGRRRKFFFFFR